MTGFRNRLRAAAAGIAIATVMLAPSGGQAAHFGGGSFHGGGGFHGSGGFHGGGWHGGWHGSWSGWHGGWHGGWGHWHNGHWWGWRGGHWGYWNNGVFIGIAWPYYGYYGVYPDYSATYSTDDYGSDDYYSYYCNPNSPYYDPSYCQGY